NLCQKTKRESHPAFFGSSPQPMSFMRLQRLHIQIVDVYRQKFLQYTGEACCSLRTWSRSVLAFMPDGAAPTLKALVTNAKPWSSSVRICGSCEAISVR